MIAFLPRLLNLLFPKNANCLGCGDHRIDTPGDPLCTACQDALVLLEPPQNTCIRCGHVLLTAGCSFCKKGVTRHIAWMRGAYAYRGPARSLVLRLKNECVADAAHLLSRAMVAAYLNDPPAHPMDVCTYVPMPPARLRFTGTNHAQTLCAAVACALSIPMDALLTASPSHKRQSQLTRQQRLKNRKGIYTATKGLSGLHILLVDDVLTTGATAAECARVLLKSGAASVNMLTGAFA